MKIASSSSGRVTQAEAAGRLGRSEKTLQTWARKPWWPPDAINDDGWDVETIRVAATEAGLLGTRNAGSDLAEKVRQLRADREAEQLKLAQIRSQQEQLRLDRDKGEVVPRDALELFAASLLTSLGDWCEQLPDLIAQQVPKKYRTKLKERLAAELDARRGQAATELERAARELDAQRTPDE